MKYRNIPVKLVPSEILLFELLQREGTHDCPKQTLYNGEWTECLVGIGVDHTSEIRIPLESKEILAKIAADFNEVTS